MPRKRVAASSFIKRAVELGAVEAKIVDPRKVPTGEWVRWKCRYGCGGYGSSLTCPPRSPEPAQTRRLLDGYSKGVLVHFAPPYTDVKKLIVDLEREAFLAGYYKAFGLGAGPCHLCEGCNFDAGCRHPDRARPAMEACGIDVFATARAAGFPIEVVTHRGSEQNYYGLLLLE